MIVWINGAYGVGKTSVAKRLVARSRHAMLIDPELIGFLISAFPPRHRGDHDRLEA